MRKNRVLLCVLAALVIPQASWAMSLHGFAGLGGEFGGDRLWQLQYANGTTASVDAGQGVVLKTGAFLTLFDVLDLQGDAAWKFATTTATNQTITWTRFPLEAIGFLRFNPIHMRVGAGLSYQVGNDLSASGSLLNGNQPVQNALGPVFQVEYFFWKMSVAMNYTVMKYTDGAGTSNGNSVGFALNFIFGSPMYGRPEKDQ